MSTGDLHLQVTKRFHRNQTDVVGMAVVNKVHKQGHHYSTLVTHNHPYISSCSRYIVYLSKSGYIHVYVCRGTEIDILSDKFIIHNVQAYTIHCVQRHDYT